VLVCSKALAAYLIQHRGRKALLLNDNLPFIKTLLYICIYCNSFTEWRKLPLKSRQWVW